jgi:UPF0755 protein
MKRIISIIIILILVGVGIAAWIFLGPATGFESPGKALYIRSNAANKEAVLDSLKVNNIVTNETAFKWLAGQLNYWQNIKPGKYVIKKGSSLLTIVRMLKNGHQTPVNLVITKLRTKEDFARFVGNRFECDSLQVMHFLDNPDSLKEYGVDTTTAMAVILPDTYTYFWNTNPGAIYKKLYEEDQKFWTADKKKKAEDHGLSPLQAYILGSIIEEETNYNPEKGIIASVYLNRMNKGMPLQADPTVKFALHNFGITRIYSKYYMSLESPYNTYKNKGLPPGPICTPSKKTIEAVLDAPQTNYLYFVVNSEKTGTHTFSETYEEHLEKAKQYHIHLDSVEKEKTLTD